MKEAPESIARSVVDECADCDICRFLMVDTCPLFPELYRLWDRETEQDRAITAEELRKLVDRCNFCALCPCPPVREKILRAKAAFVERDGLPPALRAIEDVALLGRLCGALPGLTNAVFRSDAVGGAAKRVLGIHEDRKLPCFPRANFFRWAEKRGLHRRRPAKRGRSVAYFAGCTAAYLFPEVARAAVAVLEACGAEVWVPAQRCCGMPALLEGDHRLALRFVRENAQTLAEAAADGFAIVCSCPTCGFFLRSLLAEGAYYAKSYQRSVGESGRYIRVPDRGGGQSGPAPGYRRYDRNLYGDLLRDRGPFSAVPAESRIAVAENTHDLGAYLLRAGMPDCLSGGGRKEAGRTLYFPPCHLREQKIGRPYEALLSKIAGISVETVDGEELSCCGMGGIMGFKKNFHETSLKLGRRLMDNIREIRPDRVVTDCLSCRLQFHHCLDIPVCHPVELIRDRLRDSG